METMILRDGLDRDELLVLVRFWATERLTARFDEYLYEQTFGGWKQEAYLNARLNEISEFVGAKAIQEALDKAWAEFEARQAAYPDGSALLRCFNGAATPEDRAAEARWRERFNNEMSRPLDPTDEQKLKAFDYGPGPDPMDEQHARTNAALAAAADDDDEVPF